MKNVIITFFPKYQFTKEYALKWNQLIDDFIDSRLTSSYWFLINRGKIFDTSGIYYKSSSASILFYGKTNRWCLPSNVIAPTSWCTIFCLDIRKFPWYWICNVIFDAYIYLFFNQIWKMWFVLLFLIVTTVAFPTSSPPSITTTYFIYDSVLGFACHSDTNCGGLVGNSMCLNGICACQPGYIPQGIMRCI